MIFNSVTYILFLLITVALYWALPSRSRLWLVLFSSTLFYGFWRPEFLLVMLLSATTDFFCAKRIEDSDSLRTRRAWLGISLGVNLGMLFYFKYLFFFTDNAVAFINLFGCKTSAPAFSIILPLGISFYTFETISYIVDVYRRFIKAERNFVMYAGFVTFFPKLIAGPVLRASEMLPQFETGAIFRLEIFVSGLQRILLGLFLKVVLADNISPLVDDGFAQNPTALSALDVMTLAFLFGFQIYFDFAAYSSIAIGSARLMGIHVPENFDFPYMARSPREFWKRWHISLSSWIRDYLYLPLLGVQVHDRAAGGVPIDVAEKGRQSRYPIIALYLTWAIMGFWHGANWTFVVWGLLHASFITIHRVAIRFTPALPDVLRDWGGWLLTLLAVMLAWIPFRAQNVETALALFSRLLSPREYLWLGMRENTYLVTALIFVIFCMAYMVQDRAISVLRRHLAASFLVETVIFAIVFAMVFVFLRPISQFIYFQF